MSEQISYSVRFIEISDDDAEKLKTFFGDSCTSLRRNNDNKIVLVTKLESDNSAHFCKIIPQVDAKKIDVFVSLLPETDSQIYDVPSYVLDVVGLSMVELTISFTYIDE